MSESPIPSRTLLPRGEKMQCPATVKQTFVSVAPAMVSPDVSRMASTANVDGSSPESPQPSLPVMKDGLAVPDGSVSPDVKMLAPRNGKFRSLDHLYVT